MKGQAIGGASYNRRDRLYWKSRLKEVKSIGRKDLGGAGYRRDKL
jgi:hypothetical protein